MSGQPEEAAEGAGRRASDRGRYGRLSRERVLAMALEVVDRDGLSGLSMRKLGAELGVEAMALYRYAPSKDALLDGLVEALCQELEKVLAAEPEPHQGAEAVDWRQALHHIALATYRVAMRHPNAVPLLATRLLSTPLARRPLAVLRSDERVLVLLHDAGLGEREAVAAHRAFTAWLLGYLLVELRAMDDEPDEPDPAFRLGLHRMPAQELPRLRATAIALAERGGPEQLAAGLDALLDAFPGRS
ncbi:TetR/AcrR family transcriptional regulator C-terminal domain-containing protein [Streptomyces sp. ISL-98]|uniref:TetR/AcrR family transcriptional regulator n=1 Tax=Streptomyces sp. ISL-98 TaxID=2819192 RepID=UPI001BEB2C94|nr:TetR/AcrR family transcriptional regulator C-terminal domain-containing protein [Streptomyces sp. ISL-98]MBT2510379.1 TetR/AcrR family transcriptional regulator C-terminal domain-containing protein [Streptomyces sp. ISL-98]